MDAMKHNGWKVVLVLFLLAILFRPALAAPAIKLRVTVDNASVKATPGIGGQTLTTLPLDSLLDAESQQGEWYKVSVTKDGNKISGFIHEMLVKEVSESEAQQSLSSAGRVKSQAEITAEIEIKMDVDKRLIRQENEPDKALDDMSPMLAKAFAIDDRQKQKQIACELYLWMGQAYVKKSDFYGALKEFRNVFDVDYAYAKEITKNFSDPTISGLIDHAEKLSRGLIVEYNLEITTKPKEAVLKVNGKDVGRSPEIYKTSIPKFTLEIEKEGYKPIKEEIFLSQSATTKDYTLESSGRTIALSSLPKDGKVFLDGVNTGKTTDCELPYVSYGAHSLKVVRENYADWDLSFQMMEGTATLPLSAILTVKNYVFFKKLGDPESNFFKLPKAMTFDKDGNLYIVDESDVRVKKFNTEGLFQATWGDGGRETRNVKVSSGIVVDNGGNVYVTDSKVCCVAKFDKNGKFITKWGDEGSKQNEMMNPTGLAIDKNGDLYVADTGNNRIIKYSSGGAWKKTWGKQGVRPGEFVYPTAVTINLKNEVIVVDRARVQKFSLEGEPLASWGKAGSGDGEMKVPLGVCVDSQNYVYIADTGNNRILKFDTDGKLITQWGTAGTADGQMMSPFGIAIGDKGNVFVAERDNQRFQEFRVPAK
ncbi:MAG: PEGA domain-containing protein [Candidatus Aminicenantales bacterium]